MPSTLFHQFISETLTAIDERGLTKRERLLTSPQGPHITTSPEGSVVNFCANNYLGLSNHPALIAAAHKALDDFGLGLSSVRFICGTQTIHRQLEERLSRFLGTEDAILYSSCFDANGGLFESLFAEQDAIISDELNHASIIDGIRLSKARRYRYKNRDLNDLEQQLKIARSAGARFIVIATDGVFSMDGYIAPIKELHDLAASHGALLMVDDSHAIGCYGPLGKGTPAAAGVGGKIDFLTGTFGKALGGASGGYVTGNKTSIALLRQRSRPYLFSNSVAPSIVAATLTALDILESTPELLTTLAANTRYFRSGLKAAGLAVRDGDHPIVPIMIGDAKLAQSVAAWMLELGIYVIGFSYPVVPNGQARIRTQVSAAHSREDLDRAIHAFRQAKSEFNLPSEF